MRMQFYFIYHIEGWFLNRWNFNIEIFPTVNN